MEHPFVAINFITCTQEYRERFEYLFKTRVRAIDKMPGFRHMHVLKPQLENDPYLIISYWDSEEHFRSWVQSPAFAAGHRRGFEDLKFAREAGMPAPMTSSFKTYYIISE